MKIVLLVVSLLYILNLVDCSIKRLKAKNKRKNSSKNKYESKATRSWGKYEGSRLEACMESLAKRLCKDMGKDATYVFFGNIDNYINGSLKDKKLYDNLFGNTFTEGIQNRNINPDRIQEQIMTTAMGVLGGRTENQHNYPPAYWREYSRQMAQDNRLYLNGLVAASKNGVGSAYEAMNPKPPKKGLWERTKEAITDNFSDAVEVGGKILEDGFKESASSLGKFRDESGALTAGGENIASQLGSLIIDISNYFIQRHMLNQSDSIIFNLEQGNKLYEKKGKLINIHKDCGRRFTDDELADRCAYDGRANPPFLGNHNYIDGIDRLGQQHKRKFK